MKIVFNDLEIPDWLKYKLLCMNPSPSINDVVQLLLEDYIKRTDPTKQTVSTETEKAD